MTSGLDCYPGNLYPPPMADFNYNGRTLTINGVRWSPQDGEAAGGQSSRGPHRLEAGLKCDRKTYLRYLMKRGRLLSTVKDKIPLIGTALHARAADYHTRQLPHWPRWLTEMTLEERVLLDCEGHPEAQGISDLSKSMWKACEAQTAPGDILVPHSVEREVWAPLSELDPDCPPSLRDEVVTARLDLIAIQHKGPYKDQLVVWDYKTTGGFKKKGSNSVSLPHWDPKNPWWSMHYQGALALALTRARFGLPVAGFFIIRVTREAPHVIDRQMLNIPPALIAQAGRLATYAVQHELRLKERLASGQEVLPTGAMTGVCGDFSGCEYLALCQAPSKTIEKSLIKNDYFWQKS
ncbi:MAG: PD-(D/E)XK nuclease family protein [Rhodobacteraceae bacterium]|nr:PD-(D/E)XK nuclease family protein [Paracoccaceae bacterium]